MANEHIINNNLIISGSVTSSVGFAGDGSGLTNITAEAEWDGSRNGDAEITGSFTVSGSGANVDFTNAEAGASGSFSGSFEGDGSGLTGLSLDGSTIENGEFSGSFSGSFEGDGSGLTGLNNFPFDGDAVITGSLTVSGSNIDFTNSTGVSGSFSGSFVGDASGLTNLPATEWDGSRDGDASITGSLVVSGSSVTVELKGDTTLDENIFISNTNDSTSIGIGSGSLEETTQTRNTVAIGLQAGDALISGSYNIYIGNEAGKAAIKTQGDTAVGYRALNLSTGIDTGDAENNSCNTAIGYATLTSNTEGQKGTAVGANALANNTIGLCNTALGHEAGCNITTGDRNITIGDAAGLCLSTENNNTVVGNCSGYRLESSDNVSLGKDAMKGDGDITGGTNTALGARAGECLTGASVGNVFIGFRAGPATGTTESNQLYINNSSGTPLIKGDFSTLEVEFAGGVTGSFSGSFAGDGSRLTNISTTPELKYRIYITGSGGNSINTVEGNNASNDTFSNVLGGSNNCSAGEYSSVVGGLANTASADYSIVGAGTRNYLNLSAVSSSILGGFNNTSNLSNTHIIGSDITADKANYAYVNNLDVEGTVSASLFSGSFAGDATNLTGLPVGEWDGSRDGDSSITGSLIISGSDKILDVRGGISGSTKITIGSGHQNLGTETSVAGGCCNCTSNGSSCSFIGGGRCNSITGTQNVIGGGVTNCILGTFGAILGGSQNDICCGTHSSIVGGYKNFICGVAGVSVNCNFIGGGQCNIIKQGSCHTSILNGCLNTGSADFGAILGGSNNKLEHNCSFIVGDNITSDKACYTFVNNLNVEGTVSASVFSGSFVGNATGLDIAAGSNTEIQFNNSGLLGASAAFTFTDNDTLTIGDTNDGGSRGAIRLKEEDNGTTAHIGNGNNYLSLYRTNELNALTHDGTNWEVRSSTESTSTLTGAFTVSGGVGIVKNLNVGGTITANEIVTNIVSQSIALATGSNIFGDELTDLHQFTGSLSITGSIVGDLSASGTITGNSGSFDGGLTSNGFVILSQVSESLNFQDDTEAATGGVPLGGLYRNGNFIAIRLT